MLYTTPCYVIHSGVFNEFTFITIILDVVQFSMEHALKFVSRCFNYGCSTFLVSLGVIGLFNPFYGSPGAALFIICLGLLWLSALYNA